MQATTQTWKHIPQSEPKSCVGYSAAAKPVVVVVFSSSKTSNSKSTSTHNRNGVPGSVYIININFIFWNLWVIIIPYTNSDVQVQKSVYSTRGVGTKEKYYRPRLRAQARIIKKMALPQKAKNKVSWPSICWASVY